MLLSGHRSFMMSTSQRMIFRRPMVFMRHRAKRMERRLARAVGTGSMVGAGAGAVAGSAYNHSRSTHKNTPARPQRNNDVSTIL